MSKNLWEKEFKAEEIQSPRDIIKNQCDNLSKMTDSKIIGRITEYNGKISKSELRLSDLPSDGKKDVSYLTTRNLFKKNISNNAFVYEFYITSLNTPKYKYRVFFIEYDISLYPVLFALDSDIADEIGVAETFSVENENQFIERLSSILNSDKVEKVITSLLSLNN